MLKTTTPLFDDMVWKAQLAAFAPLSEAFIAHIFHNLNDLKPFPVVMKPRSSYDQTWLHIQHARQIVSFFLVPEVLSQMQTRDRLTPAWFRRQFEIYTHRKTALPVTTVQRWTDDRRLRVMGHSTLEPNSVAEVFMMRYLFKDDFRHWLPPRQDMGAPWFHVWGVMPGSVEPPKMYPYPLSDNLPARLLLYTQWNGARWHPGFVSVPGVGAIGWGQMKTYSGKRYWSLTEEDMSAWDASFVRSSGVAHRLEMLAPIMRSQEQGFPDSEEYYRVTRLHKLADVLLEQIGEPILADYMHHYFTSGKVPDRPFIPF